MAQKMPVAVPVGSGGGKPPSGNGGPSAARNDNAAPAAAPGGQPLTRAPSKARGLQRAQTVTEMIQETAVAAEHLVVQEMDRVSHNIGDVKPSRFNKWKREELVLLLISQNIELRGEDTIPIATLRGLVEELYVGKPMPRPPRLRSEEELERCNQAALMVQNRWIENAAIRRWKKSQDEALSQSYLISMGYVNEGDDAGPSGTSAEASLQKEEALKRKKTGYQRVPQDGNAAPSAPGDIEMAQRAAATEGPAAAEAPPASVEDPAASDALLVEPWERPSAAAAEKYAALHHPRRNKEKYRWHTTTTGRHCCIAGCGQQCDLFEEGQVSEFSQYGPGITNYFKFLKWNLWIFLCLSILAIPSIVFNYYGPTITDNGLSNLAMTTAGNLAQISNVTADISIPGCGGYSYNGVDCDITPETLALMYCYLDLSGVVLVIIAYIWLRIFETKEEYLLDKNTLTAAEFSVKFDNLPPECTEAELKAHLAKVTKQGVSSVVFAHNNYEEIKAYRKRGKLVQQRYHAIKEREYYEHLIKVEKKKVSNSTALFERLNKKRIDCGAQIKAIESDLFTGEEDPTPLCAFVTFEEKIGAIVAKATYTNSFLGYLCMPSALRFKGHRLRVSDAQEPSTIIWENLSFNRWARIKRRARTMIVAAALIFVSLVAQFFANMMDRSAKNFAGGETCPDSFFSLTEDQQEDVVENNGQLLHCYCDQFNSVEQENNDLCHSYFQKTLRANLITYGASILVLIINMLLEYAVSYFSEYEKHHSIDNKGRSVFVRLFWLYVVNSAVVFLIEVNPSRFAFVQKISGIAPAPAYDNFSADWYISVGVAIILVQIGNVLFGHSYPLYQLWSLERRKKQAIKNPLMALTQEELNLMYLGPPFKLSQRYAQQVATLCVCLIFSTGIPILYVIGFVNFLVAYCIEKYAFIHLYRSPPRYNATISKTATRLVPWAVVFHLLFSIWALSNKEIFNSSSSSSNAVTEHAAVGASAAGRLSGFFGDLWSASNQEDTFPLFVLLVLVVVALLLEYLLEATFGSVGQLFVAIFGNICSQWSYLTEMRKYYEQKGTRHVTYSRAVQRGIIKGLATYNLLQNPFYMEAFAITAEFANEHHTLRSMKFATSPVGAGPDGVISPRTTMINKKRKEKQFKIKKANDVPNAIKRLPSNMHREMLLLRELDGESLRDMGLSASNYSPQRVARPGDPDYVDVNNII